MNPAFVIFMIILLLTANVYVFCRLYGMIPEGNRFRIAVVIFSVGIFASFVGSAFCEHFPIGIAAVLQKISSSWLFIFIYFLMIILLLDLLRASHWLPVEKIMRNSWAGFAAVLALVMAIMTYGYFNYLDKKRVELFIVDEKMEIGNHIKIVAFSDLHLGYNVGKDELRDWIQLVNEENPDLVLIAGDIVDNTVRPLYAQEMDLEFRRIRSKYGVYAIMGNHEYRDAESTDFIRRAGICLLRDTVVSINNHLYIAGRDDRSNANRKPLESLLAGLDSSKQVILLDHQPFHLEEAEKNDITLQLSGHTHHGQVWPLSLITRLIFEKAHGYLKKGNSHIYVSSGIGIFGGKFRIGTQSEYVVIQLKSK
ncbi:MAG: metallophosphoesterase [Tannerella sp.]|jgi:predicted MPP superfamily phosphohydrolase|nr:metallophosphoesterase [Tannerella sp.]